MMPLSSILPSTAGHAMLSTTADRSPRRPTTVRIRRASRSARFSIVVTAILLLASTLHAQTDLLPIDHPATDVLKRLARYGETWRLAIEHLPLSRREAYQHL